MTHEHPCRHPVPRQSVLQNRRTRMGRAGDQAHAGTVVAQDTAISVEVVTVSAPDW